MHVNVHDEMPSDGYEQWVTSVFFLIALIVDNQAAPSWLLCLIISPFTRPLKCAAIHQAGLIGQPLPVPSSHSFQTLLIVEYSLVSRLNVKGQL